MPPKYIVVNTDIQEKECSKCKQTKSIYDFPKGRSKLGVPIYTSECKKCRSIYLKGYRVKNRERIITRMREYSRVQRYGIDSNGYERILAAQGGCCAICKATHPENGNQKYFHIDHDHENNQVRGLLCMRCNRGIGCFDDDLDLLNSAVEYIKRYKSDGGYSA